jgi:methylmalonyl-CoA mutase
MQILSEFQPVTKEAWLAQVSKDLKGAPLESLHWPLSDAVTANPLVDGSDIPVQVYPLANQPNHWEICEKITATDPVAAHTQVMDALQGGAEGLCFYLDAPPTAAFMGTLLEGVYLDFVGLHFEGPGVVENPGLVLALLGQLATERGIDPKNLRGSLNYHPETQAARTDWRYLAELVGMARTEFPNFGLIAIHTPHDATLEAGLAHLLAQADVYMTKLVAAGAKPHAVAAAIRFEVSLGQHYFVEMARLRALGLVWLNWAKHWQIPLEAPQVSAVFDPNTYTDAMYSNMIKATTMAMSAALGGAQRITVLPYDAGRENEATYPQAFGRRIARNVQHLLKLESGFDTLTDPAAGSYYIEHLTHQIAQASWATFIDLP